MSVSKKRSVRIAGELTSVSLEDECWQALKVLADQRDCSVNRLVARIDRERGDMKRSQAIRAYIAARAADQHP